MWRPHSAAPTIGRPANIGVLAVALAFLTLVLVSGPAVAAERSGPAPFAAPRTAGQGTLARIDGADRILTSVAISQAGFQVNQSATALVLARADDFSDALAGGPLAARNQGPLLLTPSTGLTDEVRSEIQRVLPTGHTVYILGGQDAIAPAVDTELAGLGFMPVRIAGADRYGTAVDIAEALGDPQTVFEVDGTNFPDGLTAGPAAVLDRAAILLTRGRSQAPETAAYLAAHPPTTRYAIGGPAAGADAKATAFVGADRYATSEQVALQFFPSPQMIVLAGGYEFPDALSVGPVAGLADEPLILVPSAGLLPPSVQAYLGKASDTVLSAWLLGGTAAVATPVADEIAQALVLVPPLS